MGRGVGEGGNRFITWLYKDQKRLRGQGQKVMNAMWGAGQMMFNKILVLADEGATIQAMKSWRVMFQEP
jgi:UbiD family decarboxylase